MHYDRLESEPDYKKAGPETIQEFRKSPPGEKIQLPEVPENRRMTNVAFLILFAAATLAWIGFSVFIIINGGLKVRNQSGRNEESVEEVDGKLWDEKEVFSTMIVMVVPVIVSCILMLVSYRYRTRGSIIFFMVLDLIITALSTACSWFLYISTNAPDWFIRAISMTICLIISLVMAYMLRKKFKLVVAVVHEAMLAMFFSPVLLFLPLLTFVFIIGVLALAVLTLVLLVITHTKDQDVGIICGYALFTFIQVTWILYFTSGCQCMIVAGSIAAYYFANDKSTLKPPFTRSLCITVRYHLGTIAAGSLIILIITILKSLAESGARNTSNLCVWCILCCLACLLSCIEEIAHYLTKKAYIMTAIHGKGLCSSGKRGIQLLWYFWMDTLGVDFYSSLAVSGALIAILILNLGLFLAIIAAFGKLLTGWLYMGFVFLYSSVILYYYGSLLSVTIETIFLCLCEDKLMNDGSRANPYFMSASLAEVAVVFTEQIKAEHEKMVIKEQERELRNQNQNQRRSR